MKTKNKSPWTRFMDMHIEAPEHEARLIFYNRFGHNPERVSCTCCGDDYSIAESESLEQSSAYDRGCAYDGKKKRWVEERDTRFSREYQSLPQYLKRKEVAVIYAKEIKPEERKGSVPTEGYVWM